VCTTAAFTGLTPAERRRVLSVLQTATKDGGVHLVETIAAARQALDLEELRASYAGWDVSIETGASDNAPTFVARKA